jgi:hypothetical protein
MAWFGNKKGGKEDDQPIPQVSEVPLKAYVYRLLPEKVGKVQVAGRVPGDFDGWTMQQDLEDMVAKECGGGTYRCKVVVSKDTKHHIGYHKFTIPGAPLNEGRPIDEEPRSDKAPKVDANKIDKIEAEIEETNAQARLDEARATRVAKQRDLGIIPKDDDGEEMPVTSFSAPGFEDPRITQLMANQKALEARLEAKDREMMLVQHESEMRALRDEMNRKIDMLSQNQKGDGGIGAIVTAQMDATKAMLAASQQSTQAMLQSQSEMIKLVMSRDPNTGVNERVDKLVERLLDAKSAEGKATMDLVKEGWQTGLLMGRGGEQAPTSMVDVARDFSGRVLDIVGEFMRQKGKMSESAMKDAVHSVASRVVDGLRRGAAAQLPTVRALPGAIPAGTAMPAPVSAPAPASGTPLSRDELCARVDKVMVAFLHDIGTQGVETWPAVAKAEIPPDELQRIGSLEFQPIAQYCMTHGSPALVRKVIAQLVAVGAMPAAMAEATLKEFGISVNEDSQPAIEEVPDDEEDEGEEGVLADDDPEDDSLIGGEADEAQGAPQAAGPEKVLKAHKKK